MLIVTDVRSETIDDSDSSGALLNRCKAQEGELESRGSKQTSKCCPSSVVEHLLGKEEVLGSSPKGSSRYEPGLGPERGREARLSSCLDGSFLGVLTADIPNG